MPSRLLRQRDVSNDPVLKTVCESVQSALNMPYISKHCFPDLTLPSLLADSLSKALMIYFFPLPSKIDGNTQSGTGRT